jgi:lysophospholipase L1-like esterase
MTVWIFGDSLSTACDLKSDDHSWPNLLGRKLKTNCKNYARVAADNFFIYSSYLEQKQNIQSQDIVIIGWTHFSRKSFVLDRSNPEHNNAINQSFVYQLQDYEFIRSKNVVADTLSKWAMMFPKNTGKKFYDTWFNNYYSTFEQKCNLQSYIDSVLLSCPGKHLPFFFSKESVKNLSVCNTNFILDFIIEHNVAISPSNMHLNIHGHKLWSEHLYNQL